MRRRTVYLATLTLSATLAASLTLRNTRPPDATLARDATVVSVTHAAPDERGPSGSAARGAPAGTPSEAPDVTTAPPEVARLKAQFETVTEAFDEARQRSLELERQYEQLLAQNRLTEAEALVEAEIVPLFEAREQLAAEAVDLIVSRAQASGMERRQR